MITLWIKAIHSDSFKIFIAEEEPVWELKSQIQKRLVQDGLRVPSSQVLVNKGFVMPDNAILKDVVKDTDSLFFLYDLSEQTQQEQKPVQQPEESQQPTQAVTAPPAASPLAASQDGGPSMEEVIERLSQIDWRSSNFVPQELTDQLTMMGFPQWRSQKALLLNMMDVGSALEWLLMHSEDPNVDEPFTPQEIYQVFNILTQANGGLAQESSTNMEEQIRECVLNDRCTFEATGRNFKRQKWFHCYTCGFVDTEGICESCSNVCHKGHKLSEAKGADSGFFCDCGASGTCKCCNRA